MRKITICSFLLALFALCAPEAVGQTLLGEYLTAEQINQGGITVALRTRTSSNQDYLSCTAGSDGTFSSSQIAYDNLAAATDFYVEKVEGGVLLRNVATGAYITGAGTQESDVQWTTTAAEAIVFKALAVTETNIANLADGAVSTDAVRFCIASTENATKMYLNGSGVKYKDGAGNWSLFFVYRVRKLKVYPFAAAITSENQLVNGGKYVLVMQNGGNRGLAYVKTHTCGAGNTGNRIGTNTSVTTLPENTLSIDTTAIFTVEVQEAADGTKTYAFRTADGLYLDAHDNGATTAGDPIHATATPGYFELHSAADVQNPSDDPSLWLLRSTDTATQRRWINMGAADTGGLVLYNNSLNGDYNNSRMKIYPLGWDLSLASTSNLGNVATYSGSANVVVSGGVDAYYAELAADDEVKLTSIDGRVVAAGAGVILQSDELGAVTLVATDLEAGNAAQQAYVGSEGGENLLFGLPEGGEPTVSPSTAYVFTLDSEGNAVFRLLDASDRTFAAGKAYLELGSAAASLSPTMRIGFGPTTAISGAPVLAPADVPVYDLSGRRVAQPRRGIYIQGGKKVFIK